MTTFIIWRIHNEKQISRIEIAYWESADENKTQDAEIRLGDHDIWKALEVKKVFVKKYSAIILNAISLQTVLTFIAQVIGYKVTTSKKTYKWTAIIFGFILSINLWLAIFMSIVPTGPFF